MDLSIEVDLRSPVPPYEQIRAQIAGAVSGGGLQPGDRLPTVRALAADLGIAIGTVTRAYRELETAGVVESRRRTGTVVAQAPVTSAPSDDVTTAASRFVDVATRNGLTDADILDLVRGSLLTRRQA